jgi:hypothetical protein
MNGRYRFASDRVSRFEDTGVNIMWSPTDSLGGVGAEI